MRKSILILSILLLSTSCGFSPLYSQKTPLTTQEGEPNPSVVKELSSIKIEPIADRIGQELRNNLLDSLTPLGQPTTPQYRLVVDDIEQEETEQALRRDITATRIRVKYTANFQLIDNNYNAVLKGDVIAYSSFDVLTSAYSSTMSRNKAQTEIAQIFSNDITIRLASYFHSLSTKKQTEE